ncbi:MAG TPA: site-2 protease family protein, partial [bacterium]|nr:site-2 protease family protein [bacterium]
VGELVFMAIVINAGLALFNLLPIPPLDGSKILIGILPPGPAIAYARLQPYGILLLFAVVFVFPGLVSGLLVQPMDWLVGQATGRSFF